MTSLTLPEDHIANVIMVYLGRPVVALGIGVLLAYRNTKADTAQLRRNDWVESALRTSAMIIMVTGLGDLRVGQGIEAAGYNVGP